MEPIDVRYLEKEDLRGALEVIARGHLYYDGLFEVETVRGEAWGKKELEEAVSRYQSYGQGLWATRSYVAETLVDGEPTVCGVLVFEMLPDSYHVLCLEADLPEAFVALHEELVKRLRRNTERVSVTTHIRDGEWGKIKRFQGQGWTAKLVPGHYEDGTDGWLLQFSAKSSTIPLTTP